MILFLGYEKKTITFEYNNIEGINGFVFEEYSENGRAGRLYFSETNGKKIDAIRRQIEIWKTTGTINENQYYFLLASLLESADKVANTASVYGAFLKKIKKTAQKDLVIEPAFFEINNNEHQVFNTDSNLLIKHIQGDILYLAPLTTQDNTVRIIIYSIQSQGTIVLSQKEKLG
jgi:adenine-specific DNA-methyltransferase